LEERDNEIICYLNGKPIYKNEIDDIDGIDTDWKEYFRNNEE